MRWLVLGTMTITIATGIFAMGGAGCSSEPCDEAADKMRTCLQQLDCRDVDPLNKSKCDRAKRDGEKFLSDIDGVPCAAELEDRAEQINRCPISPAQPVFCGCF